MMRISPCRHLRLILTTVLLGCRPAVMPTPQVDEGGIYRSVLLYWATCFHQEGLYTSEGVPDPLTGRCNGAARKSLLVHSTVGSPGYADEVAQVNDAGIPPALWTSFIAMNGDTLPLPPIARIAGTEIRRTTSDYPAPGASVIHFSRPGYSASRDSALVEVFEGCGALCGFGKALLLRRTPAGWRLIGAYWTSMS